ncbi:MAG: T9SS type A sorting domain-containing protein [Chlorobi bacterium]|nr:T9SS type A sorting domain-containing protein [Chlorobiota bacterium]
MWNEGTVTGIGDDNSESVTEKFRLKQNYPNPFNPSTVIEYSVPENSYVELKVYDIIGNEITTLVSEEKSRGYYQIQFNAKGLSSGTYIYSLRTNKSVQTKKMILMK